MTHRRLGLHYFVRAGLLSFFAFYILRLVKQDQLIIYIGPRMQPFVKLAAIGFYVFAVLQLYLAFHTYWGHRSNEADCGCGACSPANSSTMGRGMFYVLFTVPVLLFLLLPDTALSSSLVQKKGITLTGNGSPRAVSTLTATTGQEANPVAGQPGSRQPETPEPAASPSSGSNGSVETGAGASSVASTASGSVASLDELFPHDEYSEDLATLAKKLYKLDFIPIKDKGFMETVSSIDFYMNNFIGKKIEITGFVYREEDMGPNQFVVSRFAVQCCSADASPFGFMAESASGQNLKQDTWVKVTGTLAETTYGGNGILKINAAKVERIDAPSTPYIFPDMDYFTKNDL